MSSGGARRAFVRLIDPAIDDLDRLLKLDPQIVRQVLKKMLLLERDPRAGAPLVGDLIGWRKLTVGDRHWRIVWRITTDDVGNEIVEIAEVWAAGARSDADVYEEMSRRVAALPQSPTSIALADVVAILGRSAVGVVAAEEPAVAEPVPEWLAQRLRHQAGISQAEIDTLSAQEAMSVWEAHLTKPRA